MLKNFFEKKEKYPASHRPPSLGKSVFSSIKLASAFISIFILGLSSLAANNQRQEGPPACEQVISTTKDQKYNASAVATDEEGVSASGSDLPSADHLQMNDEYLQMLIRVLADNTGNQAHGPDHLFQMLFHQVSFFKSEMRRLLSFYNKDIDITTRAMRNRRVEFAEKILLQKEGYKAFSLYENIFHNYYLAASTIILYSKQPHASRKQWLMNDTSQEKLLALAQGKVYRDIRQQISDLYRQPSDHINEAQILDLYDQIISRAISEVRYVDWYLNYLEQRTDLSDEVQQQVSFVLGKLSPQRIAKRFRISALSADELQNKELSERLLRFRPQINFYWLRHKVKLQKKYNRKLMIQSLFHLESIQKLIAYVPSQTLRKFLSAVSVFDYDIFVIKRYVDSLETVILATPENRLRLFLSQLEVVENEKQFLQTLARIPSAFDVWNELKVAVEKKSQENTNSKNYEHLYELMNLAEEEVKSKGLNNLSIIQPKPPQAYITGWVVPGAIGLGTLAAMNWDFVAKAYTNIVAYATTLL